MTFVKRMLSAIVAFVSKQLGKANQPHAFTHWDGLCHCDQWLFSDNNVVQHKVIGGTTTEDLRYIYLCKCGQITAWNISLAPVPIREDEWVKANPDQLTFPTQEQTT